MKRFIFPIVLFAIAVSVMPAYADPSSSPFEILNEKLDTIQQTLDNEVVPRLDEASLRTPISQLPYTISEPGSYYVTGDLTTASDGIIVNADNVTIDLMGNSLIGPGSGITYGIYMNGRRNVELRNGTLLGFAGNHQEGGGIVETDAGGQGKGHRVLNVRAVSNGRGIYLGGSNHLVKDCTVLENGSYGIAVGKGCTVSGNTLYGNGDRGISIDANCTVTGNTSYANNSDGIHADGSGSTISGNSINGNGNYGIAVADGCLISNNTIISNGNGGIAVRYDCLVKNNTLKGNNPSNIDVTRGGNSIEENLVTDSTNGVYFHEPGNFYANNRASGNSTDYANTAGNTDGGGNVSF